MWQKLKSFLTNDAVFHSVLLLLVAVGSFGLGRQSVDNPAPAKQPLFIKENATTAAVATAINTTATTSEPAPAAAATVPAPVAVVGSKSGTKYHLPTCSGAKRIKPENLISFESIEAAKAAGYTAAANCPGLQ